MFKSIEKFFSWLDEWLFGSSYEVVKAETGEIGEIGEEPEVMNTEFCNDPDPVFENMTKLQLDEWAEHRGIKLDRRKSPENMIKDLKAALNK